MKSKQCAGCGKAFHPRAQTPKQAFCSSPACQRERRRRWQYARRHSDPEYGDNQSRAQESWAERHPDYRREYDLSEAEKAEFDSIKRIGEEISSSIEYTPARVIVLEHARAKYVCIKDGESTIRTAYAEPSPLPKSNAGASLLAQILTATFADHLPLNQQEGIFKRHGVDLHRSTLCEYKLGAGELLAVLRAPLIAHVLAAPRVHSDDTTLPLLEKGRGSTRTARVWGYLGAGSTQTSEGAWVEHPPAAVFEFTESREAVHPSRFLNGYSGYLQVDAYSGYVAAELMLRRQFRVRICPITADSSPHIRNDPQTKVASGMSSMKAA